MKMCEKHYAELRKAIELRGLNHLVSANGREAAARTFAGMTGQAEPDDFDPLMSAVLMTYSMGLKMMGPYLLGGDYCVLCEVVRLHPEPCPNGCTTADVERQWIEGPAEEALRQAHGLGLVQPI